MNAGRPQRPREGELVPFAGLGVHQPQTMPQAAVEESRKAMGSSSPKLTRAHHQQQGAFGAKATAHMSSEQAVLHPKVPMLPVSHGREHTAASLLRSCLYQQVDSSEDRQRYAHRRGHQ